MRFESFGSSTNTKIFTPLEKLEIYMYRPKKEKRKKKQKQIRKERNPNVWVN